MFEKIDNRTNCEIALIAHTLSSVRRRKTKKQQLEELDNTRTNCGLVIAYLLVGMFLTAWNLLIGILFLGIPLIALISYFMIFVIKDLIKGFSNML